jgi:hypothetical protein
MTSAAQHIHAWSDFVARTRTLMRGKSTHTHTKQNQGANEIKGIFLSDLPTPSKFREKKIEQSTESALDALFTQLLSSW